MRFLARREHSREELKRKLFPHCGEGEDLDTVLDELTAKGWLSDARYAEQAIRSKSRRFGPLKLAHTLRAQGVDEETIAAGFRAAGAEGQARIQDVWSRRFHGAPADDRERARQVRFLQNRGFSLDEVLRFLKTLRTP
jgi:regulatory protein